MAELSACLIPFHCDEPIRPGASIQARFPEPVWCGPFLCGSEPERGQYAGKIPNAPDPEGITRYVSEVSSGRGKPLDFTLYVPPGFDNVGGAAVPNVEATTDPAKVFTASFAGGREVWTKMAG
jgi:hypothetical protein